MKGSIVKCLEELIITEFGKDKWEKSLEDVGIPKNTNFLPTMDIDDADVMKVVKSVCKILNICNHIIFCLIGFIAEMLESPNFFCYEFLTKMKKQKS